MVCQEVFGVASKVFVGTDTFYGVHRDCANESRKDELSIHPPVVFMGMIGFPCHDRCDRWCKQSMNSDMTAGGNRRAIPPYANDMHLCKSRGFYRGKLPYVHW